MRDMGDPILTERLALKGGTALSRLLASRGYSVRHRPDGHAGGKWLSRYASALGGNATLELDVNYMARQPLFGATRMEVTPPRRNQGK